MREGLQAIDTAAVDELGRIKQEQDVLEDRMEAMTAKRGAVSEEVFARVKGDYETRFAALEQEAEPLKARVREEFAVLQGLVEKISTAHRDSQLEREELEFRHSLGEFDDAVFSERAAAIDEQVAEREAEVAEADSLAQRFVAVFHSEEDLLRPGHSVAMEAPKAGAVEGENGVAAGADVKEPAAAGPAFDVEATAAGPSLSQPEPEDDAGGDRAPEHSESLAASPEPVTVPPPVPVSSSYATDALEVARLVAFDVGGRITAEFNLQLGTTTIGRAPKNDIRIRDASVSREHAKIVFTERGFAIYDLGSENGVWVNGERTKHKSLSEDDVVEFGPGVSPLVFKGP